MTRRLRHGRHAGRVLAVRAEGDRTAEAVNDIVPGVVTLGRGVAVSQPATMASFTVLSALSLSPQVNTVPALSTITIVNKTPAPNTLLPTLSTPNLMQTSVPAVYATYSYATQGKLSASSAIAPIKQQSQTVGGSVQDSDIFRSLVFNALILLCILVSFPSPKVRRAN